MDMIDKFTVVIPILVGFVVLSVGLNVLEASKEQDRLVYGFCLEHGYGGYINNPDGSFYCLDAGAIKMNLPFGRQVCIKYTGLDCLCPSQVVSWFTGCGCPPINATVRWC